jgi:hypothetical protein
MSRIVADGVGTRPVPGVEQGAPLQKELGICGASRVRACRQAWKRDAALVVLAGSVARYRAHPESWSPEPAAMSSASCPIRQRDLSERTGPGLPSSPKARWRREARSSIACVSAQAKPGKEEEVVDFLVLPNDEAGRDAHFNGKMAVALVEKPGPQDCLSGRPSRADPSQPDRGFRASRIPVSPFGVQTASQFTSYTI